MAAIALAFRLAAPPGNHNADPRRLISRWRVDAAGRLVCSWQREDADSPARTPQDKIVPLTRRQGMRHGDA